MGHLQRIILIHTHLQSVVELRLDAHANICGSNAAGKTTLQRLIPVFYGEQPSRVVPRTRKAFHQFYLPHANSYLVYEYVRENGDTAMAVLTRHPQDGVEYRFVASPYRSELFLRDTEDGPQGVDYGQWVANLRRTNIDYSPKLDATSEYRTVILNDLAALTGRRIEQDRLRQLALRYSLVTPGHRLRHIEKLVSAVHAREGKMQTLKTMLAAIFEDDGVELPVTRLRREQARDWVRAMRQALNLQQLQGDLQRWKETARALAEAETQLARLTPQLQREQAQQQQALADTEARLNEIDRQLGAAEESHQKEHGDLQGRRLDLQRDADRTRRTLADLQQHYEQYQRDDLPALERDTQALPAWRQDEQQQRELLASLQANAEELRRAFDRQRADWLDGLQQRQQAVHAQIEGIRSALDTLRTRHRKALDALAEEHDAQRGAAQQKFITRQAALTEQLSAVKARLHGDFLTLDEHAEVEQAQQRVERQQQASAEAATALGRAQHALRRAVQAHDEAVAHQQALQRTVTQQEKTCERLQRQLEPAAGTLRRFLRDEHPGWETSAGKIVRAELLERKDLAPQRSVDQDGFYGIKLDLSRVETPECAQDDLATQQALATAQTALERTRIEAEQYKEQTRTLEAARSRDDQTAQAAQRDAARAQEEVGYAQAARDNLRHELKARAEIRRRDCAHEQEALDQQQRLLATERDKRLGTLKDTQQAQREQLREEHEAAESEQKNRIQQIEHALELHKNTVDAQIRELQTRLHADMADRGIDAAAVERANTQIQTLTQRIAGTVRRADELREYQDFMRVTWQQERPELQRHQTELASQLEASARAIAAEAQRYDQARAELQKQRQHDHAEKKQSVGWLARLLPLLSQLAEVRLRSDLVPVPETAPTAGEFSLDELLTRTQDTLLRHTQQVRQMQTQRQEMNRALTASGDADFISRLNYAESQLERDGAPHPSAYPPLYEKLLTLLADQQTELTQQGRNMGGDLNKFFTVFRDVDRRIAAQSRRLSDEVRDELPLEGISKAEVRIGSIIAELEFWQPLARFSALYQDWMESGRESPDEAYLNALAQVAELLRQDQAWRFEDLLRLELRLSDGGNELVITNDRQLLESSSHGMAYLILCRFLLAFTRLLRRDAQVTVHWPIDEIGTLSYGNVERLFHACEQNHIWVLGAFPNAESDVLQLFKYRYLIERTSAGGERRHLKRIEPRISPLAEKLKQLQQAEAVEQTP